MGVALCRSAQVFVRIEPRALVLKVLSSFRFLNSTYPRSKSQPNDVKHFVAKLVKSFGRLGYAAESLDDFRYTKALLWNALPSTLRLSCATKASFGKIKPGGRHILAGGVSHRSTVIIVI
jgi:hypothetical protein